MFVGCLVFRMAARRYFCFYCLFLFPFNVFPSFWFHWYFDVFFFPLSSFSPLPLVPITGPSFYSASFLVSFFFFLLSNTFFFPLLLLLVFHFLNSTFSFNFFFCSVFLSVFLHPALPLSSPYISSLFFPLPTNPLSLPLLLILSDLSCPFALHLPSPFSLSALLRFA